MPIKVEPRIDRANSRSGLHAHALATVEDLDTLEVPTNIDQDALSRGLTSQGRSAGAQGHGHSSCGALGESLRHLPRIFGHDDSLGNIQIVRCIGGVLGALYQRGPHVDVLWQRQFKQWGIHGPSLSSLGNYPRNDGPSPLING